MSFWYYVKLILGIVLGIDGIAGLIYSLKPETIVALGSNTVTLLIILFSFFIAGSIGMIRFFCEDDTV